MNLHGLAVHLKATPLDNHLYRIFTGHKVARLILACQSKTRCFFKTEKKKVDREALVKQGANSRKKEEVRSEHSVYLRAIYALEMVNKKKPSAV